jgi:hypothetical protein
MMQGVHDPMNNINNDIIWLYDIHLGMFLAVIAIKSWRCKIIGPEVAGLAWIGKRSLKCAWNVRSTSPCLYT